MTATYAKLNGNMLADRIDATYYCPEYIANELRLRESGLDIVPLNSLVTSGRRAVYFDTSTLEETAAPPNWLPFLTADDFGANGFFLNLNARRRVSPDFGLRYPNGLLRANELLVKVKGPNQITAYNGREPDRGILVSGTIWGALVRCESVDPHYLVTALSSTYAATARTRLRTNLNVEFLSPTDLLLLDLPLPRSRDAQNYVGEKVRQAERLRIVSNGLAASSHSILAGTLPGELPPNFRDEPRRITSRFVTATSLNPEHARALEGHSRFRDFLLVRDLVNGCKCGDPIREDARVAGEYWYYGASGPIDRHDRFNFDGEYLIVAQDGTIGRACVARGRFWANNHVWILKVKDEFDPDSIATYLDRFYPFWRGMTTGSVVPKVTAENLLQIVVPRTVAIDKTHIGRPLRKAGNYRAFSSALTDAAKLLVEALIERRISESDLSIAQKALERGDQTLDRAILSRLTDDGIDVAGKLPLFPDLDALYSAIDEAQHTQPSNGDAA